jgi:hypothetical protein
MFTMKELKPFIQMAATRKINEMTFTLEKVEELSAVHAVWMSESYKVYATPNFDNIPVSVHVVDCNEQEIGTDGYPVEVDDFERYCKCVKVLT